MATAQKSASDRLTEIWKHWSLGQNLAGEDAKVQKLALAALSEAIKAGGPSVAVRSMQALLVDPELPGASDRPLFEPLWQAVRDHWGAAGTGNPADVMRLQALLLAAWDDESASNELFPALVSPWGLLRGRDRQRSELAAWLVGCQHDEQADWGDRVGLSDPKAALAELHKWRKHRIFAGDATEQFPFPTPANLQGVVPSALVAERTQQYVTGVTNLVHRLLSGLYADNAALRASHDSQELLWWGQALYCYSLRCSFRRITDPDVAIWWATVEAADRSVDLPVEPAASYLQEVLRTVGVALDEKRTMWEHACSLGLVLKNVERTPLPDTLAELVRDDAFGLPVNLLCAEPGVAEDVLRDSLGVEPDVMLDRGEWAAWVFRELVLQRRWPAPEPTT